MNRFFISKRFIILVLSILAVFWLVPKVFAVSPVQLPYNDGGGSGSTPCKVTSASFDISPADSNLLDSPDLDSEAKNPLGLWYSRISPPPVSIDIKTSGCSGKTIQVTLSGQNPGNVYGYNYSNVDALRQKNFVVPTGDEFKINMTPGQEGCNTTYIFHGTQPPCRFFIIVQTPDQVNSGAGGYTSIKSKVDDGNAHGLLTYDCDGKNPYYCAARSPSGTRLPNVILSPWVYRSDTSANQDNNVNLQANKSNAINPNNTIYSGLSDALDAIGVKVNTITSAGDLGTFINAIIAFITAIMGVIAVIMIMYEGFVYMRSDNVDFKTRTRGNIVKVVLGFLLLLSTYVILKTINPDLLNLVPNISGVIVAGQDGIGLVTTSNGASPAPQTQNNTPAWVSQNGASVQMQLPSGSSVTIKPCDTSTLVNMTVFGRPFVVSKYVVSSLKRIDEKWQSLGGNNFYRIPEGAADGNAMGAYNCELVSGTNTPAAHAYGLALDVNPQENSFGSTLVTDMPAGFIKLFTDEGWGWGGNWRSKKDAMHFSKLTNEQGNMKASDNS